MKLSIFLNRLFCNHSRYDLEFVSNIHGDAITFFNGYRSIWRCPNCGKLIFKDNLHDENVDGYAKIPDTGIGDLSDGYHTFNELYHHRAVLFSVICNEHPELAWKSKHHNDGTMYDGMFIVGINTPDGPATYHYDIDPYWDMFNVKEYDFADVWDGHTPDDAIKRITSIPNKKACQQIHS